MFPHDFRPLYFSRFVEMDLYGLLAPRIGLGSPNCHGLSMLLFGYEDELLAHNPTHVV